MEDRDADTNACNGGHVLHDDLFQFEETSFGVDSDFEVWLVQDVDAAPEREVLATAVRHASPVIDESDASVGLVESDAFVGLVKNDASVSLAESDASLESDITPILVAFDAATLKVCLDDVPSFLAQRMVFILVVLHAVAHGLGHEGSGVALEDVDGHSQSDLHQKNQHHQGRVRVEHASVFSASSTASEEGDDEDDVADDDEDHGRVQVGAA